MIIPKPKNEIKINDGLFSMPPELIADLNDFEFRCLSAFIERCGLTVSDLANVKTDDSKKAWIHLERCESILDEGYDLSVDINGIKIKASTEQGVVWALCTLTELKDILGKVPFMELIDFPKYKHRGLMLDCARHFFSTDDVKKIIEQMSRVKMNVLHWHLTDDQGWRIESKKFPKLHEKSKDYYSHEQICDVIDFASKRGVEIIPEIDMPGHMTGLLAAYPQYSCCEKEVECATSGGIYRIILCPGKEETFSFIEELLEEVCGLFPSKQFHIGGDEAPKYEWKQCPRCKRRMEEEHLEDWEDLQGYFSMRVIEMLRKKGKYPVLWNDALSASNLPGDMMIQYWHLQHKKTTLNYIQKGCKYIYSNMLELYFDYPYSMSPLKRTYNLSAEINKSGFTDITTVSGIECCLWTEHVYDRKQLETLLFPRIFAVAETAWSYDKDYRNFLSKVQMKLKAPHMTDVIYTPLKDCSLKGKARREDALAHLRKTVASMSPEIQQESLTDANFSLKALYILFTKFFRLSDIPYVISLIRNSKRKKPH